VQYSVVAATALLLSVMFITPAEAAESDEVPSASTTWSVRLAGAEGADGRAWLEQALDPGAQVREHMEVRNLGKTDADFTLQAADGYFTDTGRFNMLPRSEPSKDAGTWISLPDSVHVRAGETAIVPFTISVPDNATPGDHPAGVAAGVMASGDDAEGNSVGVDSRVGFRVMVRVKGELAPALTVEAQSTYLGAWNPFRPGRVRIEYTIHNSGNARLSAAPSAAARGLLSASARVEGIVVTEFAPGETRTGTITVPNVWPAGSIDTTVFAEGKTVPESDTAVPPTRTSVSVLAVPWPQLSLLLALAALTLLIIRLRRFHRARFHALLADAHERGRLSASESDDAAAQHRSPLRNPGTLH